MPKLCVNCFTNLRKNEIVFYNDKFIIIPKILNICSDCWHPYHYKIYMAM